MADVGLHRAEGAESLPTGIRTKCLRKPGYLDRITQDGARPVRLDVPYRFCPDVGHGHGSGNRPGLAVDARRGVADLPGAVVVDRGSLDHRVNVVSGSDGIRQTLEDDQADPAAPHGAVGLRIERPARPARGQDVTVAVPVACRLRNADGDAARESHVALSRQQALAGEMHGHQ